MICQRNTRSLRVLIISCLLGSCVSLAVGCIQPGSLSNQAEGDLEKKENSENSLVRSEILEYLDKKEIELKEGDPTKILKSNISALEMDSNRVQVNDGPWQQEGTFLVRVDDKTWAVRFEISYRKVEGKFAFFDFKVEKAVQQ